MREIMLFVEDFAHQKVIGALIGRLAAEHGIAVNLTWRNARHGHGAVVRELHEVLRDLKHQRSGAPDLLVVASDANCKGLIERSQELTAGVAFAPLVLAIPDPHIERWLLLDSAAFKQVFGRGCDAPDQKCARGRYKQRLIQAIRTAGITPSLGGIEFAEDIVQAMDVDRAARQDSSLARFVGALKQQLQEWSTP